MSHLATMTCSWCCVGCTADDQLHIPRAGVLGADVGWRTWERHSASVVDTAATEDGYRAGRCQHVLISVVRPAAQTDCQWWSDETGARSPRSRVLYTVPPSTAGQRLWLQPSKTVSTESVQVRQCPSQSHRPSQNHWSAVVWWRCRYLSLCDLLVKCPQCRLFKLECRSTKSLNFTFGQSWMRRQTDILHSVETECLGNVTAWNSAEAEAESTFPLSWKNWKTPGILW